MNIKAFTSLYGKEFFGWFSGTVAAFLFGIYLVLSLGISFYFGNFFKLDNQGMASYFYWQPLVFSIIIPAIVIPLWADEKRSHTIEFLLSQPVSFPVLVTAKFFAAWSLGILMLVLSLPLVFSVWFYAGLNVGTVIAAYLACLLTIGAFTALGCVASALSASPVIAYLGAFAVISAFMYINPDIAYKGLADLWAGGTAPVIDLSRQYQELASGRFSLSGVIYFLSIIILSLWLNTIIISNRKN